MASGTATSSLAATNIMLAINEKKTSSVEFYYPVRYYVLLQYSETEFQNLVIDLQSLTNLRSVVENPTGSLTDRLALLIRYFKALCSFGSVLPFSPQPNHINAVLFTWYDAFKKECYSSQPNLDLEKASVMFNLGAVYSQIGLSSDRSTTAGIKRAVKNFRGAAAAFAYLKDRLAPKVAGIGSATVDLSVECAWALERLMLAQARECFYEDTIAKGSTHVVCAKISRQVGVYYKEAFDGLNVVPLSQYFDRMWMTQIQLKAAIFSAESCFRYSLDLREKEKIGERIARLQIGISDLPDVKEFSTLRGAPEQLLIAVNNLKSNLSENLQRAIEENNSVYHQSVPCSSSLRTLPALYLPKPKSMDKVLDASKDDVFAHMVLDVGAKAFPEDTGTVEEMIGLLAKKLEVGSEQARVRLEKMHLPESIDYLEEIATLPEELEAEVEAVQISGALAELQANLQQLAQTRRVNQELLKEVQEDGQFRGRWLANPQLRDSVTNLLQRAADSEKEILRSFSEHSALMSILDRYTIAPVLQPFLKPYMSFDANEAAIVGTLKWTLMQLTDVVVGSVGHMGMLKEIITKLVNFVALQEHMKPTQSHLHVIDKWAMEKLNEINVGISENYKVQHQTLENIEAQKRDFSVIFNLEDFKEKRTGKIQAALAKYHEIKKNIKDVLDLNATLQMTINRMKSRAHEAGAVQSNNTHLTSPHQSPPPRPDC